MLLELVHGFADNRPECSSFVGVKVCDLEPKCRLATSQDGVPLIKFTKGVCVFTGMVPGELEPFDLANLSFS